MPEVYCAQIENGLVTKVIVCDGQGWAQQRLGGQWVYTGTRLVGIGWLLVNGEIVPPTSET